MASKVQRIPITLPYEGMDLSIPAEALPPTRTDRSVNLLHHENFRARQRGPIIWKATTTVRDAGNIANLTNGVYGFPVPAGYDRVGMSGYTFPLGANVAFRWQIFEENAPTAVLDPTPGRGAFYTPSSNTLATCDATNSAAFMQWSPNWTLYKSAPFTVSMVRGNVGASNLYQAYQGKQIPRYELWKWTGTALGWAQAGGDAEAGDSAPRGLQAICAFSKRLWIGGGAPPGTSNALFAGTAAADAVRPNTLWFTEVDADPTVALNGTYLNNWKAGGLATGVKNNIVVGSEDPTDFIMQMVATDKYMLILKRNSTWVLTGSGLDTFSVRKVADYGIVDPRGVVTRGSDVYFITPEGLARYDGYEVTLASDAVRSDWTSLALTPADACLLTDLGDGYIFVSLQTTVDNNVETIVTGLSRHRSYLYHVPTQRWSYFDTEITATSNFGHGVRMPSKSFFVDGAAVYLSGITRPDTPLSSRKSVDLNSSSTNKAFQSGLRYPVARLSATHDRSQLHRVGVNYRWLYVDTSASSGIWQMWVYTYSWTGLETLSGGQVQPITVTTFLNSRQLNTAEWDRRPQTAALDIPYEVEDAYVEIIRDVTAAGGLDTQAVAELRDGWWEISASPTFRQVT